MSTALAAPLALAPVDAARIQELRELDDDGSPEFLRELVTVFIEVIVPDGLRAIEGAIVRGDPTGAERAAHSLRSSALNLGALPASELCSSIEGIGRKGSLAEVGALHARLRDELSMRVCPALAAYAGIPSK